MSAPVSYSEEDPCPVCGSSGTLEWAQQAQIVVDAKAAASWTWAPIVVCPCGWGLIGWYDAEGKAWFDSVERR